MLVQINSLALRLSHRLVFDRESGKAKGFGFCEFHGQDLPSSYRGDNILHALLP
jgi:hypothetical protein